METNAFNKLYNNHVEYQSIRNKKGDVYAKYIDDVKYWKVKYIEKLVLQNIKNKINSVLEVGCATGELLNFVLNEYEISKKIGIDISNENIKTAKLYFDNIDFFAGTFEQYKSQFKIKTDLIILSDILEHVENDISLLEICGKNSKYVVLNLPIEKVKEYEGRVYGINDTAGHLRAYSTSEALELCEKANMEVIEYTEKQYVFEPIFRKYLLNKILKANNSSSEALIKFHTEIIDIELNPDYYKRNFFSLLKAK